MGDPNVTVRVSLCFGTLNRKQVLAQMIEDSLFETSKRGLDLEIVPVDGGSVDGTEQYLSSLKDERVKPILLGHRSSYPDFMNRAVRLSTGNVIVQWNDDSFMQPDGWGQLFDEAAKHLYDPNVLGFRFPHYSLFEPASHEIFERASLPWGRELQEMEQHTFLCFGAYYRSVFTKFGLYHPKIEFYHCDTEFCRRVAILSGLELGGLLSLKGCRVHHLKMGKIGNTSDPRDKRDLALCHECTVRVGTYHAPPSEVEFL